MSKKTAKNKKQVKKDKPMRNPANYTVGKIIIAALAISFVLASVAMVIYFIVQSFLQV